MSRYFLLSWDCLGFECVQDVTALMPDQYDKTQLLEALKGNDIKRNPLAQQISHMKLRARFNPQRNYEIYVQEADEGIEEEDLRLWANSSPQSLVDYVRKNHYAKILDDRAQDNRRVIV